MKKVMFLFIASFLFATVFAQEKKTTEIKINQLPKGVSDWVTQNVAGGKITRAGKIEEKGVISYVAMVDMKGQNRAFLFDKDGKFTGKGDDLLKKTKPPVKTQDAKPPTKAPATTDPAPKK
jgi:hypothetical protein